MNVFIFITTTMYTSFIFQQSHGFEVNQPRLRLVNPDGVTSINCEHTANVSSVRDVQLNSFSPSGEKKLLCQKGMEECDNVIMRQRNPNSCLFILHNIGPAELDLVYQCEFTVKVGELDVEKTGEPTKLLPGRNDSSCPPPAPPAPPTSPQVSWRPLDFALIGLLLLLFLYGVIVTVACLRHRSNDTEPENSTYVEMRKAPPPVNAHLDTCYR